MFSAKPSRLAGLKVGFLLLLCLWLGGLICTMNGPASIFQKHRIPGWPFGFFSSPGGALLTQDFSYNVVFFRGIRDHLVDRPYLIQDQEKMIRGMFPRLRAGLSHAYSPVAFTLMLPLLGLPGEQTYLIYSIFCAVGILLLFQFCLLPRVENSLQLCALAVCAGSVCLALSFFQGQSAIFTTSLLGAFWVLLQRRTEGASLLLDFGIAILFWALCVKPSVTIIPLALLLGSRAWRPLALGGGLLAINWIFVAGFYGGWWTGFWDYLYLLDHYNNADFTPFMRRDYIPGHDGETRLLFQFDRFATLALTLALVLLRWRRLISLPELFQGMIGVFLLFSPYLLPSEDWILCLLVAETSFLRPSNRTATYAKLFLLVGILDLRADLVIPWQINFDTKCLLFSWLMVEALLKRSRDDIDSMAPSIS